MKKNLKWKKSEIQFFNRESFLTIFGWHFETEERCKGVHCVDRGESFPTSIYLQNLASIQLRTSFVKFACCSPRTDPPGWSNSELGRIFVYFLSTLCTCNCRTETLLNSNSNLTLAQIHFSLGKMLIKCRKCIFRCETVFWPAGGEGNRPLTRLLVKVQLRAPMPATARLASPTPSLLDRRTRVFPSQPTTINHHEARPARVGHWFESGSANSFGDGTQGVRERR